MPNAIVSKNFRALHVYVMCERDFQPLLLIALQTLFRNSLTDVGGTIDWKSMETIDVSNDLVS
jgi:hypothetical protein